LPNIRSSGSPSARKTPIKASDGQNVMRMACARNASSRWRSTGDVIFGELVDVCATAK